MSARRRYAAPGADRPDIVVILADDIGFSDIGSFGSEIPTPHIDALAECGAAHSALYDCARCCPTRAALLTGLYPHKAGIGHLGADLGGLAYEGILRSDAAMIAERLHPAGYRTLMSGKWRVGGDFDPRDSDDWRLGDPTHPTPRQRGFDEFYGLIDGPSSFFSPHCVLSDDGRVDARDPDFHFIGAISDAACDMVRRTEGTLFLYLAYTAPHRTLHTRVENVAAYDGAYAAGWDAIRAARHEELNGERLLRAPSDIAPKGADATPLEAAPNPAWEAARMAAYAAMVTQMDRGIGRIVETLKSEGRFDNTLLLFHSDSGGCAELIEDDGWALFYPTETSGGRSVAMGDRPDRAPDGAETFMSYELPWANVSNAPLRLCRRSVHEGGMSTPLIASRQARIREPVRAREPAHVFDILPTLLAAAGASPLAELDGRGLRAPNGEDLTPLLIGAGWRREASIFWEREGDAAIRAGAWKLLRRQGGLQELSEMDEVRTELRDRAPAYDVRVGELAEAWGAWANEVGVHDWSTPTAALDRQWGMEGDR